MGNNDSLDEFSKSKIYEVDGKLRNTREASELIKKVNKDIFENLQKIDVALKNNGVNPEKEMKKYVEFFYDAKYYIQNYINSSQILLDEKHKFFQDERGNAMSQEFPTLPSSNGNGKSFVKNLRQYFNSFLSFF